jgi:hypothetical protein
MVYVLQALKTRKLPLPTTISRDEVRRLVQEGGAQLVNVLPRWSRKPPRELLAWATRREDAYEVPEER